MDSLTLTDIDRYVKEQTAHLLDGDPLDGQAKALIELAVAVSVNSLSRNAIEQSVAAAFDQGATIAQVQEMIALASGLGVHSLMASATQVLAEAERRHLIDSADPLDVDQQSLWDKYVGTDPYWATFSEELPGFLDSLLRLSPDVFAGFFEYCALPWSGRSVRAVTKELAALACDATPAHRFGPGLRVHLCNAIKLGAGRKALRQTLAIAAAAPKHNGYA